MTFDAVRQDLFAGLRIFRSSPGLSATVVVLVALVIGGNTTIYSLVHSLLTKPAAGIAEERLVTLEHLENGRAAGLAHSYADYQDFSAATSLDALLVSNFESFGLTLDDGTYAVRGASITANYFDTLGVRLARGRTFTASEEQLDASGLVAVISDRLWDEHFARRDDVIGTSVLISGHAATIVGVAPRGFRGVLLGESSDVWVPYVAYTRARGIERGLADRSTRTAVLIGRLAPDASMRSAIAEFGAMSARLSASYPDSNKTYAATPVGYSLTAAGDSLFATRAPLFLAIFSVVTAVTLVIVCANVANLMLARVVARQKELAVRLSLGASRSRVLTLLMAEGVGLALVAWACSVGFAWWVSQAVVNAMASGSATALLLVDFTPDATVLGYALLLAVAGAVLFSVAPIVRVWRQDLLSSLKPGEAGTTTGRARLSRGLAVVQLAFCVLLLVAAGLLYRSSALIATSELGFDADRLLIVRLNTSGRTNSVAGHLATLESVRDRLGADPTIAGTALVSVTPPRQGRPEQIRLTADARPLPAEQNEIGPGFFDLLAVRPIEGREFAPSDTADSAAVAIVNQHLASALWPGQSALGRTFLVGQRPRPVQVVGVVSNAQFDGFRTDTRQPLIFRPTSQSARAPGLSTLYVRYRGDLDAAARAVRRTIRDFDSRVPIESITSMDSALVELLSPIQNVTRLLTLFATGALLIAAIGLYGVITFNMRQRTREFGIRLAIGASARQVVRSVVGEGVMLAALGVIGGFVLSAAAATIGRGLLYGVTPLDARTYAGVFALLTLVALLASYLPARRASRVDPVRALRQE